MTALVLTTLFLACGLLALAVLAGSIRRAAQALMLLRPALAGDHMRPPARVTITTYRIAPRPQRTTPRTAIRLPVARSFPMQAVLAAAA